MNANDYLSVSTQFPTLRQFDPVPGRFDQSVESVFSAVQFGSIRNVVLQDAKLILGGAVEAAWRGRVSEPYFYGKIGQHPPAVQKLYSSINLTGLHDLIATSKKVHQAKNASCPAVEAMRALCAEALPLALAVASLKDKVVKGRAPRGEAPAPVNPNKLVKTCPVCFRAIAVLNSAMAHHGFRRPGGGWQTASCAGVRFQPLEVSSAGLKWLIETLRERLSMLNAAHSNQTTQPEYLLAKRTYGGALEIITRDDPLWAKVFDNHIAELEFEISGLKRRLPSLEKKLTEWKPEANL